MDPETKVKLLYLTTAIPLEMSKGKNSIYESDWNYYGAHYDIPVNLFTKYIDFLKKGFPTDINLNSRSYLLDTFNGTYEPSSTITVETIEISFNDVVFRCLIKTPSSGNTVNVSVLKNILMSLDSITTKEDALSKAIYNLEDFYTSNRSYFTRLGSTDKYIAYSVSQDY